MSKIFGVGMPKTGTSSLHRALQILGFSSCHFPHDDTTVKELELGNYRLSILDKYDAISDVPVPAIFAQLDQSWPGSKFILTEREVDSWLDSCEHAWFNEDKAMPRRKHYRYFYRALLYGCAGYNRDRFRWVFNKHTELVKEHFSGDKEQQLLVLNIAGGEGWDKLCPFLDVPIPDQEFPHANPRPQGGSTRPLGKRISSLLSKVRRRVRSRLSLS